MVALLVANGVVMIPLLLLIPVALLISMLLYVLYGYPFTEEELKEALARFIRDSRSKGSIIKVNRRKVLRYLGLKDCPYYRTAFKEAMEELGARIERKGKTPKKNAYRIFIEVGSDLWNELMELIREIESS